MSKPARDTSLSHQRPGCGGFSRTRQRGVPAVRTFCLLVAAQLVCLVLGLWLESQFAQAIIGTAAGEHASASPASAETPVNLRLIALFWIGALQALVAYLILSPVRTEVSRKETLAVDELMRRQNDLVRTRDAVIFGLAKLAESRDPDTGNHLERIALFSTQLAVALRRHYQYRDQISASFVKLIGVSSALHDIGKVGVHDAVLLKAGKLTAEETLQMQTHSRIGGQCIRDIERRLGDSNFLQMARDIAMAHHERWDGSGYPNGLAGESIPLAARIVAIADVYDALRSKRVYKEAYSHERTVSIICEGAGSHFDPGMVEAFMSIQEEFREIARRCGNDAGPDDMEKRGASSRASPVLSLSPDVNPAPSQVPSSHSC